MSVLPAEHSVRWLLALVGVAIYIGSKVRTYNRLRAFKGPFSKGFSEFWRAKAYLGLQSHLAYKEVCDRYGTIARVGPNDLVTSSPELLTHMNAVRSSYTRGAWYNLATRFQPGQDHVFSEVNEVKHTKRRQQMAAGYSGKENLELERSIDARIAELVHLIRSKYLSTESKAKPMDLARKIQFLTLDVISSVGFGEPFGNLRTDSDVNEYAKSSELGLYIVTASIALGLTPIVQIPFIARNLGPAETDKTGYGKLIANARIIIEKRLQKDTENKSDMLASFVRHGIVDQEDLIAEACLQIMAGSDTTAAALRAIMLYLLSHPRVYKKLQAEVDAAARDGVAPSVPEIISDAQVRKLQYLQAVVKEGVRVHPPVTDAVPKRVPEGGDTVVIDGRSVFLPGGTDVSYAAWPLHFSKKIFGEDAEEFRPERWLLEKDESKLSVMHKTHELIFGYGKYQCLGRPIALMEIGKTIYELMRNFDWRLAKPESPWKESNFSGIFTHSDMWVLATERDKA